MDKNNEVFVVLATTKEIFSEQTTSEYLEVFANKEEADAFAIAAASNPLSTHKTDSFYNSYVEVLRARLK